MKHLFRKADNESHNFWMSYTDLMSGFLIVFIIASIIYYNRSNQIAKLLNGVPIEDIVDWIKTRPYEATLVNVSKDFKDVFEDIPGVEIIDSLGCIRIYPYVEQEMFKSGNDTMLLNLESRVKVFGAPFVKRAMDLIDEGKDIQEIRIEGHTDSDDTFMNNLFLSSRRAYQVYKCIHDECLSQEKYLAQRKFMEDKMIAVGYSEARLIDDNGQLVNASNGLENKDNSRRIEFRIIGKDKLSRQLETN